MLQRLVVRWVALAAVIALVAKQVPGITVHGGLGALLWLALLLSTAGWARRCH